MRTAAPDWIEDTLEDLPPLCTTAEAVSLLRTSRRNLYRMVARGRLNALRQESSGSSRLLFPRSELARFLRSMEGA